MLPASTSISRLPSAPSVNVSPAGVCGWSLRPDPSHWLLSSYSMGFFVKWPPGFIGLSWDHNSRDGENDQAFPLTSNRRETASCRAVAESHMKTSSAASRAFHPNWLLTRPRPWVTTTCYRLLPWPFFIPSLAVNLQEQNSREQTGKALAEYCAWQMPKSKFRVKYPGAEWTPIPANQGSREPPPCTREVDKWNPLST